MKKLFTLIALMCMVCAGAWAAIPSGWEDGMVVTLKSSGNWYLNGTTSTYPNTASMTINSYWVVEFDGTGGVRLKRWVDNLYFPKYQGTNWENVGVLTANREEAESYDVATSGTKQSFNCKSTSDARYINSNSNTFPSYGSGTGGNQLWLVEKVGDPQVTTLNTALALYAQVPGRATAQSGNRKAFLTAINTAKLNKDEFDALTTATSTYSNAVLTESAKPLEGVKYLWYGRTSANTTKRYATSNVTQLNLDEKPTTDAGYWQVEYVGDNIVIKNVGEDKYFKYAADGASQLVSKEEATQFIVETGTSAGYGNSNWSNGYLTLKNAASSVMMSYGNTSSKATGSIVCTYGTGPQKNDTQNGGKHWSSIWRFEEVGPAILPLYTVVVTGAPKDNAGVKISETIIAKDGAQIYYDENLVLEGAEVEGAQTPTITVDKTAQTITVEYTMTINFTLLNRHGDGTHSGLDGLTVGTFSAPYDVKLSGDVKAYTAVREGDILYFEPIGNIVPANEGVLLYAEGYNVNYDGAATYTEAEAPVVTNNVLKPLLANATVNAGDYVLTNAYNGVGFYPRATATTASNKAYIPAGVGAGIRGFVFGNEDGLTTAISQLSVQSSKHAAFDLAGRRVNAAVKGISIVNGKKFIK